jgi:hypothetical protein
MQLSDHLHVFNHIVSNGNKVEDKYFLDGIHAWHDLDGYSCFIGYKDVTLSLYFHGKFSYDFDNEQSVKEFKKIIANLVIDLNAANKE